MFANLVKKTATASLSTHYTGSVISIQQRFRGGKYIKPTYRSFDLYENDPFIEEEQAKLKAFLGPLGLESFAEKFKCWDHMITVQTLVLRHKFGMDLRQRTPYQYKYKRWPIKKLSANPFDGRESEDELETVIPTPRGLFLVSPPYPSAPIKDPKFIRGYGPLLEARNENEPRLPDMEFEEICKVIGETRYDIPQNDKTVAHLWPAKKVVAEPVAEENATPEESAE